MRTARRGAATSGAVTSAAARPSITIRAIDRAGKRVPVTASPQSPRVCPACLDETLTSAHPARVPKGTYNISAWVQEPNGSARTLVSRELVVTRSQTITFDARKGRPVRFTVNDHTVTQDAVEAEPFSPAGWAAFDGYSPVRGAAVYAPPRKMAPGYRLYLQADLTRPTAGDAASPVEYILVRLLGRTIPARLTFASSTSGLARDQVTVREIDPGMPGTVWLEPESASGSVMLPSSLMGQSARTPFSIRFDVTPGYRWQSQAGSGTMNLNNLPLLQRAHSHAQTFNRAMLGPSPEFGVLTAGSMLEPSPQPWGGYLLDDPTQDLANSSGLRPASTQIWLYEGHKLRKHTRNGGFAVKIPAAPHWYTMKVRVNRATGARLSASEFLSLNFRARAGENLAGTDFWPRLVPSGLNWHNAARRGSRTTVPIWFTGMAGNIAAHNVRVWASDNDGKRWTALRVSRNGLRWSVTVPNPKQAGYVSLRAQGTDAAGTTASVTVISAYAVS